MKHIIWGSAPDNVAIPQQPSDIMEDDQYHIYYYMDVADRGLQLPIRIQQLDRQIRAKNSNSPIWLHIYSYGGSIVTGLNIYDQIQQVETPVYAVIDGIAASAATLIAFACDQVFMQPNAHLMIHQLSSFSMGTYNQIQDDMKFMNKLMDQVVEIYLERSSLSEEDIRNKLMRDTWIDSEMALKWGMSDGIIHLPASQDEEELEATKQTQTQVSMEVKPVTKKQNTQEETTLIDKIELIFEAAKAGEEIEDSKVIVLLGQIIETLGRLGQGLVAISERVDSIDAQVADQATALPHLTEQLLKYIDGKVTEKARTEASRSQVERDAEEDAVKQILNAKNVTDKGDGPRLTLKQQMQQLNIPVNN